MSTDKNDGGGVPDDCPTCGAPNTNKPWRCEECGKPFGSKAGASQ